MKHTRIWVDYAPEDGNGDDIVEAHPGTCREIQTWCDTCGCCHHCYHACDCQDCGCHEHTNLRPPVLHRIEDET